MKKKLIASILAALMVTSLVPASAFAATQNAGVTYASTIVDADKLTAADLAGYVEKLPTADFVKLTHKEDVLAVYQAVKSATTQDRDEFNTKYATQAARLTSTVDKLKVLMVEDVEDQLAKITTVVVKDKTSNDALDAFDALKDTTKTEFGDLQDNLKKSAKDKAADLKYLYANKTTDFDSSDEGTSTIEGLEGKVTDIETKVNVPKDYKEALKAIDAFYEEPAYLALSSTQRDLLTCVDTVDKAKNKAENFKKEDEAIQAQLNKMAAITKLETADQIANAKKVLAEVKAALKAVDDELKGDNGLPAYTNSTTKVSGFETKIKEAEKALKKDQGIKDTMDALKPLYDKASSKDGLAMSDLGAVYSALYTGMVAGVGGEDDADLAAAATAVRGAMDTAVRAQIKEDPKVFEQAVMDQLMNFDRPTVATLKTLHKPVNMYRWYLLDIRDSADSDGSNKITWTETQAYKDAKTLADANVAYYETLGKAEEARLTTPNEKDPAKQGLVQKVQSLVNTAKTPANIDRMFKDAVSKAKTEYAGLSDYAKSLEIDGSYYYGDFTHYKQTDYQVNIADSGKVAENVSITEAFAYLDQQINGSGEDVTDSAQALILAVRELSEKTTADKLTLADKEKVYAVKAMYDSASDKVKAAFKTYGVTGSGDSAEYTYLMAAVKKIDQLVVKDLNDSIAALTIVKEDAPAADVAAAKKANKEARDAYDALTDSQKAEVNITKLERAEAAVAAAELYAVKEQLKEIAKLDFDKLTKEDAAKIEAAKAAVDALTDAQKASLKDTADYKTFTEKALPALAAAYDLAKATVAPIDAVTYNAKEQTPAVKITNSLGAELTENEDFVAYYTNNKNAGEATVTIEGRGEYEKTKTEAKFTINPRQLNKDTASLAYVANKAYTGKAIKQTGAAVKWANKIALSRGYYTLSYKNNTKVGTATITATGRGNYAGTISKTFKINPAKEAVTLTKGTKKFTAKAAVAQSGVKYQFAWKASTAKTWKTWKTKYTTKTVTGLKSGKTYQVKVRAIKTVNGQTYYGAYSNVKTVKVK